MEGDWPDCYEVTRYVKGRPNAGESAEEVLKKFNRWPTWMWANEEVEALAEWLHRLPDRERFYAPWGHRAIGVVYHPDRERFGNYVPSVMPLRYDAVIYLDETEALHPYYIEPREEREPPETYPWAA